MHGPAILARTLTVPMLKGGFLRLVVVHQTTFFVNSLAHYVSKPRYNTEISARDNWAVALLTRTGIPQLPSPLAGRRNGIRGLHWEPAKWFIGALRALRLAGDLWSTPAPQVEQARLQAALRAVEPRLTGLADSVAAEIHRLLATARAHLAATLTLWRQYVAERSTGASNRVEEHAPECPTAPSDGPPGLETGLPDGEIGDPQRIGRRGTPVACDAWSVGLPVYARHQRLAGFSASRLSARTSCNIATPP